MGGGGGWVEAADGCNTRRDALLRVPIRLAKHGTHRHPPRPSNPLSARGYPQACKVSLGVRVETRDIRARPARSRGVNTTPKKQHTLGTREIILRRRATLMAAALGGIATTLATAPVSATDDVAEPEDTQAQRDAYETARVLSKQGAVDEALAVLRSVAEPNSRNLILRARILRELKRYAEARTDLAVALARASDPESQATLQAEVEALTAQTVELILSTSPQNVREVFVDGTSVGQRPVSGSLYVSPGRHLVTVLREDLPPETRHIHGVAGTIASLDVPTPGPGVCLSVIRSHDTTRPPLSWGVGGAQETMVNRAFQQGAPLIGGSLAMFIAVEQEPFRIHVGPIGGVFASERGIATLGAMRFEMQASPMQKLQLSLGTDFGYLKLSDKPEPAQVDGVEGLLTTSSFFVRPEVGMSFFFGPIQLGPRVGIMISRAEDGLLGTFAPSYVSIALWANYVHLPHFWD